MLSNKLGKLTVEFDMCKGPAHGQELRHAQMLETAFDDGILLILIDQRSTADLIKIKRRSAIAEAREAS